VDDVRVRRPDQPRSSPTTDNHRMRTSHALILAGAILGAGWIMKPIPVEQISQEELRRREQSDRWFRDELAKAEAKSCAESIGKTFETLNLKDPAQEAPYRKCMQSKVEYGALRQFWNRLRALFSGD
jgi:hypothetical protein